MPLSSEELTQPGNVPRPGVPLMLTSEVHPLLVHLKDAVVQDSVPDVITILSQLTPLPSPPPGRVQSFISSLLKDVVARKQDRVLSTLLVSEPQLVHYRYSCLAVEAACKTRHLAALQLLLDAGWDINEAGTGRRARPVLRLALDEPEVHLWLLEHGADPNVEDDWHVTTLEWASSLSDLGRLKEEIAHGGKPANDDSILFAARAGNIAATCLLLEHGANINRHEKDARTRGPPPRSAQTALHLAVKHRHEKMTAFLLEHGALITEKDAAGRTPLDVAETWAERLGDDSVVRILRGL